MLHSWKLVGSPVAQSDSKELQNLMEGGCGFHFPALLVHSFPEGSIRETLLEEGNIQYKLEEKNLKQGPQTDREEKVVLCAGCGAQICDRYFLFVADKQWHSRCLKCCVCLLPLESELTCFSKEGNIYCKSDYYRRFSVKSCDRCHLGILASEMVMRARDAVFHLGCFTCRSCDRPLLTGDLFGMREGQIYCHVHYESEQSLVTTTTTSLPSPPVILWDEGLKVEERLSHRIQSLEQAPPKPRSRRRRSHVHHTESNVVPAGSVMSGISALHEQSRHGCPQQRTKRIRTCFKNHQLRTMESYFAVKHNPDGKDWEQLSKKTGLPKRVLQVWFQNARAKLRKSLSQEENTDTDSVPETTSEQLQSPQTEQSADTFASTLQTSSPLFTLPDFSSPFCTPQRSTLVPMMPIFLNIDPAEPLKVVNPSPQGGFF
ncbi:LIM/homeobox protein Lhx9-like [Protopterus annectens]|uniref:LIM/homeobox protein Lhx9-like n=1 Tax=Protopterus annectens TaxID=7888 RepID=UPI001CFB70EC|nr:LIM/homeobox protein Lhx9-like [Protopterus annectens]